MVVTSSCIRRRCLLRDFCSRSQAGFTLMEVLVATTLVAGGMTAISGIYTTSVRAAAIGERYENARSLAEYKLEEILTTPITANTRQTGDWSSMSWTVDTVPQDAPGLIEVNVVVSFSTLGIERELTLSTLHTNSSLGDAR